MLETMLTILLCLIWISLGESFLLSKPIKIQRFCYEGQTTCVSRQWCVPPCDWHSAEDPPPMVEPISKSFVVLTAVLLASPCPSFAQVDGLLSDLVDPRFFVAGGLCAAISHGVTTPIDVVKTRMQANPYDFQQGDVFGATLSIVRQDGVSVLLGGLGPSTVVGYLVEGAAKFGLYESLKPVTVRLLALDSPGISYLVASVVAGAVASIILLPMEQIRIRLVTDPNLAGSNFWTGVPRLIQEVGMSGLFDGLPAMLSKQVPYTAGKQVSFDVFASFLYSAAAVIGCPTEAIKFEVSLGAAALASVVACIMSHPGDVILTASYKSGCRPTFLDTVAKIYRENGWRGFLSGISARFLHVGLIITSQLVLYDEIKQLLGLPATGS